MKYWEVIADNLSAAGWSWGLCSAVTKYGWRWVVDAHGHGRRYIASDDLLVAILNLPHPWLKENYHSRENEIQQKTSNPRTEKYGTNLGCGTTFLAGGT